MTSLRTISVKPLKTISAKLSAWRRYRETVRELSQFSDHELSDIGIRRCASKTSCGARRSSPPGAAIAARSGSSASSPTARSATSGSGAATSKPSFGSR
jgi:uncharacterized protein YjiS (DUF1127 family)